MCGIIAVIGDQKKISSTSTKKMLQSLKKRGPDQNNFHNLSGCFLGHQRLSIIDIKHGTQPMNNEKLWIIFNGEIYNYLDLKKQLEDLGEVFLSNSDTEVILRGYKVWKEEVVKKMDGMFAFVIWDDDKKEAFLGRDRLGQKPLYYHIDKKTIFIASEIKSLLDSGVIKPKLDYGAIDNFLRLMYIPPWKSVYKNIEQLPPAHYAFFKDGKIIKKRYWKLKNKTVNDKYNKAKTRTKKLLKEAVKKRMLASDVEIGTFLSGGVDSSIVNFLIDEQIGGNNLKAYSISYSEIDEFPFAKKVVEKTGANLKKISIIKPNLDTLIEVVKYFDEPHADTSDLSQYLISKTASKDVKVILSGDAADEIFLGYKWHFKNSKIFKNSNLFQRRIDEIAAFDDKSRLLLWNKKSFLNNDIFRPDLKSEFLKEKSDIFKMTLFDITSHLPGQILSKVDRLSMAHSLEVRSPFLDTALIEYAVSLPYEYKIKDKIGKFLLREILSDYIGKDFAFREKQGFGSPIWLWLNDKKVKEYIKHNIYDSQSIIKTFLNSQQVDNILDEYYLKKKSEQHRRSAQRVWVLLILEIWMRNNNYLW